MVQWLCDMRRSRLLAAQAADIPACLNATALLPMAVTAEYGARACGLPAVFVVDMINALFVSCWHKTVAVSPYPRRAPRS